MNAAAFSMSSLPASMSLVTALEHARLAVRVTSLVAEEAAPPLEAVEEDVGVTGGGSSEEEEEADEEEEPTWVV